MLKFQRVPDEIFQHIISETLLVTIEEIEHDDYASGEFDDLINYPRSLKVMGWPMLLSTLKALKKAHESATLYEPTDYHWLLLYELLKDYAEVFGDMNRERPAGEKYEICKRWGIETIEWEGLVDRFFWDTDFLFEPEHLMLLSEEQRRGMGLRPETLGLTLGVHARPEDLCLKPIAEEWAIIPAEDSNLYRRGCSTYPEDGEE